MSLPTVLQRLALPVIGSPLFIICDPELVIAQCKAGIVGSLPALNARPASQLDEWLARDHRDACGLEPRRIPDRLSAPFAVNQIVHKLNDRLEHDLAMCVKYKVPIDHHLARRAQGGQRGGAWLRRHRAARRHQPHVRAQGVEKGADGLIAVAAGAGGHAGVLSPFALIQEIRAWFDGPLALSGAIANGGAVLAAQAMGADLAYIGSAFIATQRGARDRRLQADDRRLRRRRHRLHQPFHRRARQLPQAVHRAAGLDPEICRERSEQDELRAAATAQGKAWKDIWGCGQGIGAVPEVSTAAAFVERLKREYQEARQRLCGG